MKRVLQHSKTGLYLNPEGKFTRFSSEAQVSPNLAAAMIVCARFRLNPTDFIYRIVETPAVLTTDFADHCRTA